MATVTLDLFDADILPLVPGCSVPMARHALLNAAVEFCSRSLIWDEKQSIIPVTETSFPYVVPTPPHSVLAKVKAVHIDGIPLAPTSLEFLDRLGNWESARGAPTAYLWINNAGLRVYPLPNNTCDMQLTVAYTPARNATVVEDFLYYVWVDTLVSGALRKLMAMPGQLWSNPEGAAYHTNKFEQGVREASIDARRDMVTRSSLRVAARRFA